MIHIWIMILVSIVLAETEIPSNRVINAEHIVVRKNYIEAFEVTIEYDRGIINAERIKYDGQGWYLYNGHIQTDDIIFSFTTLIYEENRWTLKDTEYNEVNEKFVFSSFNLWGESNTKWIIQDGEIGYCPCPDSIIDVHFDELQNKSEVLIITGGEVQLCEQQIVSLPYAKIPKSVSQLRLPELTSSQQGLNVSFPLMNGLDLGVLGSIGPYVSASNEQHRFLLGLELNNSDPFVGVISQHRYNVNNYSLGWRWRMASNVDYASTIWKDAAFSKEIYFPREMWVDWKGIQLYVLDVQEEPTYQIGTLYRDQIFWKGGGVYGSIGGIFTPEGVVSHHDLRLQHTVQLPYLTIQGKYNITDNEPIITARIPFYGKVKDVSFIDEFGIQSRFENGKVDIGPTIFFHGLNQDYSFVGQGTLYIKSDGIVGEGDMTISGRNLLTSVSIGETNYGLLMYEMSQRAYFLSISEQGNWYTRFGWEQQLGEQNRFQFSMLQNLTMKESGLYEVKWKYQNLCQCFGIDLWSSFSQNQGFSIGGGITTVPTF
jgi:hypothetical protein